MPPRPFYFCHLSDTHLMADPDALQHGVKPYHTLHRIIEQICGLDPAPAFVMITGDLINDDDPQSYRHLKQLTNRLPMPVYFALGNHDLRQPFRHILLGESMPGVEPYYYTFQTHGYRFVVLDSLVAGEVGGRLDPQQLTWLDETLAAGPQQPAVLFVHHPPARTGIAWLDDHAIANRAALLDILCRYPQIQRVFFGHVHMPIQITVRGVHCSSVPSTCYQFGDAILCPKVSPGPPSYGMVHLHGERVSSRIITLA